MSETVTPVPQTIATTPLPQPLNLSISQVEDAGATIVPLFMIPYDPAKPDALKLGIPVIITAQDPNTMTGDLPAPVLYEFDTGGKGFWANAAGLNVTGKQTHGVVYNQYASGITYVGTATDVYVSLPSSYGLVSTQATVGLVDMLLELETVIPLTLELPTSFPIYNYFVGDFGASLQATQSSPVLKHSVFEKKLPADIAQMLGVLSQIPYKNGAGFIIDVVNTEPYDGTDLPAGTRIGRLILGGIDSLASSFPFASPMKSPGDYQQLFTGGTSVTTYEESVIAGTAYVQASEAQPASATDVPFILDTGATLTTFYGGTNLGPKMAPKKGDTIVLNAESGQTLLNFVAGDVSCRNQTKWSTGHGEQGSINTGLAPFRKYPVLYNLSNGTVAFPAPATP
ncbi:hypothetical protein [Azospirillum canadense]|uniref:hypothetical protein n=1 Tax=Azospirillum canadense TaxID=403962 RepID=UPI002225C55C|nr:hypothetical protein [Azospirillum canadense]MCW2243754.1 hypothetical protein [Azospirillum canadense]